MQPELTEPTVESISAIVHAQKAKEQKEHKDTKKPTVTKDHMGYSHLTLLKMDEWSRPVIHIEDTPKTGNPLFECEAKLFAGLLLKSALSLIEKSGLDQRTKKAKAAAVKLFLEDPELLVNVDATWNPAKITSHVCILSGMSPAALEKEGHLLRSQGKRPAVFHTWIDPITKDKCFLLIRPIGQRTKEQLKLQAKRLGAQDHEISRDHSTTSHHQRSDWEGTANFVRITAGVLKEDGTVEKIIYDGAGRGSLPPYQDFKKKDPATRWAILANTLRRQEEIMSALARAKIEQDFSDPVKLRALLQARGVVINSTKFQALLGEEKISDKDLRDFALEHIDAIYDAEHPLEVKEVDVRVISPGQKLKKDDQDKQLHDTGRAMALCNSLATMPVDIVVGGKEKSFAIKPQSTLFCFGVNWWRGFVSGEQKAQNAAAMNALFYETYKMVTQLIAKFPPDFNAPDSLGETILQSFGKIKFDCGELEEAIQDLLKDKIKLDYQQVELLRKFSIVQLTGSATELEKLIKQLNAKENEIAQLDALIYSKQLELNKEIGKQWASLVEKKKIKDPVFSEMVKSSIKDPFYRFTDSQQEALCKAHNLIHRFADIQELYSTGSWTKPKNNFLLQSLLQQQVYDLGLIPNGGCKSFNDRGVVAVMTTVTDSFNRHFSANGLYPGKERFYDKNWQDRGNKVFRGAPPVLHVANTGVGGGKFKGDNPGPHSTSKIWGKIADWAQFAKSKFFSKQHKKEIELAVEETRQAAQAAQSKASQLPKASEPKIVRPEDLKDDCLIFSHHKAPREREAVVFSRPLGHDAFSQDGDDSFTQFTHHTRARSGATFNNHPDLVEREGEGEGSVDPHVQAAP